LEKRRVIFITDGDAVAKEVIESVAEKIGGRCISSSAGNPTPLSGLEIVNKIKETPYDPVLVMFDDNGRMFKGKGETAMEYIAKHPEVSVLGAIAVASNTKSVSGIKVDFSIDQNGKIVKRGVNKNGLSMNGTDKVYGDTVDILNFLELPIIIGIGDIGKMDGRDHLKYGSPITLKAINFILEGGGCIEEKHESKKDF